MIYDISPPVTHALEVWPSDTPPSRELLLDMKRGANITLSTINLGAHVEAPVSWTPGSQGLDTASLEDYLGPCQVIRLKLPPHHQIGPDDLPETFHAERILIATGSFPDARHFGTDYVALSPELIPVLRAKNVRLIGLDTPSVDLFDTKDRPTHEACLRHHLAILEGIVLIDIPDGLYELIALPLHLVGFDASPVRAILRTLMT